eukprot:1358085-Prymnesium_polylepis.2
MAPSTAVTSDATVRTPPLTASHLVKARPLECGIARRCGRKAAWERRTTRRRCGSGAPRCRPSRSGGP